MVVKYSIAFEHLYSNYDEYMHVNLMSMLWLAEVYGKYTEILKYGLVPTYTSVQMMKWLFFLLILNMDLMTDS